MRRLLLILSAALAVLVTVLLVRTAERSGVSPTPVAPADFAPDEQEAAAHLAEAIRFATISPANPAERDDAAFVSLRDWLASTYPRTHEVLSREVMVDDTRIEVREATEFSTDPSPVSDPDGPGFRLVAQSARATAASRDLLVAPYLVIGGTDARYWAGRAETVLRFLPIQVGPGDLARLHGTDERLRTRDVAAGVAFFHALLRGSDTGLSSP